MVFNSLQFLFFFPIVVLLYFIIPLKMRYIWLLITSYYFYMCWNAKYALLILFSTVVTYLCSITIEYIKKKQWSEKKIIRWKKTAVIFSLFINLSILFFFKYFDFVLNNFKIIFSHTGIEINRPQFDIILPVGISFYTFQALGYTLDVYQDKIYAEKNFMKYALFVSFFPQLVAGPIERSKNLLKQINTPTKFDVESARLGLLNMAYGLILKMVIADRIATIIDPILLDYELYNGMMIFMCIVLFSFQIYCDFHGYTSIAMGTAKILGFNLQENFKSPYFALNIKDFWRRWHISLTSWFTDYLYIPLGGNKKGKFRKYINTMIVFLCSGMWHGASWGYIAWGGINGLYLVIYDILTPLFKMLKMKINMNSYGWKIISRAITFLLVNYSWLYFRARGLKNAYYMQIKIIRDFHLPYLLSNDLLTMFRDYSTIVVLIFSLLFLALTDYLQYKGWNWKAAILNQTIVYRWIIYVAMLFLILIFGIWGEKNAQTQFIYFQF